MYNTMLRRFPEDVYRRFEAGGNRCPAAGHTWFCGFVSFSIDLLS